VTAAAGVRIALRAARGTAVQQAALDAWTAATRGAARALIAEGVFTPLVAPADVRVERLAAGCVCCIGRLPLQVTLMRVLRALRAGPQPSALLLLVADGSHLPRVQAQVAAIAAQAGAELEDSPMQHPHQSTAVQRIAANGIDIAYRIDGEQVAGRPWLVFAHSLASDHTMWEPQAAAFAGRFNLLRYDLRGHGGSSAPAADYPLDLLARDALALLDALAIGRCVFVGLSLGGMVAQAAALMAPARFDALVLADTTSRQPPEAAGIWRDRIAAVRASGMAALVQPTLDRWFTPAFRARAPETVARIGRIIAATAVDGYVGCAHAVANIDLTDRLSDIRCPTLVLVGADDPGTPPSMARAIAQAIRGSTLIEIAAAAHLANLEQPQAFNAALDAFLSGLAPSG
jgi:3-oxoadipate enol-lactonase